MSDADKSMGKRAIALAIDYKVTFESEHGSRVLRHLMKRFGFMHTSFADDPYVTAFNEGQRAVVIEIFKKLKIDVKKLETEIFKDTTGESDVIF
jgi:hypothetical protein